MNLWGIKKSTVTCESTKCNKKFPMVSSVEYILLLFEWSSFGLCVCYQYGVRDATELITRNARDYMFFQWIKQHDWATVTLYYKVTKAHDDDYVGRVSPRFCLSHIHTHAHTPFYSYSSLFLVLNCLAQYVQCYIDIFFLFALRPMQSNRDS